jgi:hypothetical protein
VRRLRRKKQIPGARYPAFQSTFAGRAGWWLSSTGGPVDALLVLCELVASNPAMGD